MKRTNINIKLSLIQSLLLILNLFVFSSNMKSLPWFMENAFGRYGILITAPLLFSIGVIMIYFQKYRNHDLAIIRQIIPFSTSIFSIYIIAANITDLSSIIAIIFNFGMLLITIIFLFQDIAKVK